ncbi:MAG TPA: SPFH domain-containing protein [Candidatus Syntrophosphaera sp.]|jgi:membrane protease subunit (stomatin/prohibitin family)|nr:SPFH domain-containing protein [Candidatus Syntrophosphaera thermopropionivorans]HRQ99004.1 SPFH domain-containing protein [Candidatus Syntrophosphaera sp.]HRR98096.1 SPFH domain-containing protein [Candidatus Syntrophosphaera sp.]HRU47584.1 SPFH domain-containing protein [Candidatus Syntrophosphaera sp.]
MAIIDVVSWTPESNDIYAWKFPHQNLSTYTQLIVNESQEAILFSKGKIIGKFGPGKHTLNTENLPILRNLFGIPFGGKNPFFAEVWFVNKVMPLTIDWKTSSFRYNDPDYHTMVPLYAEGRYGLRVDNAEVFLVKLVGTLKSYTANDLTNHFIGALEAKTKSVILSYIQNNKIGIQTISGALDDISNFLRVSMEEFWEQFGMELTGFFITTIDIAQDTEDGKQILQAISQKSAQSIAGYTWQQDQSFNVAKEALTKGGDVGLLGAVLITGGLSGGSQMGQMIMTPEPTAAEKAESQKRTEPETGAKPKVKEVFCSNCSRKIPVTSKYCPYCGDPYLACPRCGADNAENAKRCVACGMVLKPETTDQVCSRCGAPWNGTDKFCSSCGYKLR